MKPVTTWIVIADGARARIIQNDGPGKGITALPDLVLEGEHLKNSEIMADKPGRSFESVGGARHAMEPSSDPHELLKEQFIKHVADTLHRRTKDFDRVVLVAPPAALGMIRKCLAAEVSAKVTGELAKDLTHVPNNDLDSHLAGVLPL